MSAVVRFPMAIPAEGNAEHVARLVSDARVRCGAEVGELDTLRRSAKGADVALHVGPMHRVDAAHGRAYRHLLALAACRQEAHGESSSPSSSRQGRMQNASRT